jgi:hypothetical protein
MGYARLHWVSDSRSGAAKGGTPDRKAGQMGIGVSVFLMALGAILTFATEFDISGLDVDVVGVILMLAGVVGLIMTAVVWGPRRRASRVVEDDVPVTRERRVYEDRPPL